MHDRYVEVANAHHAFNVVASPRTVAMGDAVVRWLRDRVADEPATERAIDSAECGGTGVVAPAAAAAAAAARL